VGVGHEGELTYVVVRPGSDDEARVVVDERLFVGRECHGIDHNHRLLIDDPEASRDHLEIRVDGVRATVVDTSTNGTRLNGVLLERAVPVLLKSGDRLRVGAVVLEFRSDWYRHTGPLDSHATLRSMRESAVVLVVGDVANYTTITQHLPAGVVADAVDGLFGQLRTLLRPRKGSLSHYAGDAFFAVWEADEVDDAAGCGIAFALEAAARVAALAPAMAIHESDGTPVRMGWGIVGGRAAIGPLAGGGVSVLGDATNLAFRLAGTAGREDRPDVLVTEDVRGLAGSGFTWTAPVQVTVKGREGAETVYGVLATPAGAA
jgi:adenylate cyclase